VVLSVASKGIMTGCVAANAESNGLWCCKLKITDAIYLIDMIAALFQAILISAMQRNQSWQ
jgi:hypothetical protein